MKKISFFILFMFLLVVPNHAQDKIKVGFVGNSITAANVFSWTPGEPWSKSYPEVCGQLFQKYFGSVADIRGFGNGGKTLVDMDEWDGSYMRTETFQDALTFAPDILFISLGTNDGTTTSWPVAEGCRGYELEFYGDYLSMIDSFLLVNPKTYFVLCFPPPIFEQNWVYIDTMIVKGVIPEMRKVLATTGYDSLDWHTLLIDQTALFPDHIHPTIEGSELMGQLAFEKLLSIDTIKQHLGSTSLLLNKEVVASSSSNGTEGTMAIDNDPVTCWETDANSGQSLIIDLGYDYEVSYIQLKWEGTASKDYIIDIYNDTTETWLKLAETSGYSDSVQLLNSATEWGSRIRLTVNHSDEITARLKEFEVYGNYRIPGEDITSLGGEISTQYTGSPSGEDVTKFIDDNLVSKFLTFHKNAWVRYDAPDYYSLNGYTITSAHESPDRDPVAWKLSGSKDGDSWVLLDEVSDFDFPTRYQTEYRLVEDTTAYAYFKLDLTCGTSTMQVGEMELLGEYVYALPEDTTLQVKPLEAELISLYPNPCSNQLYITGLAKPARLSVFDLAGIKVTETYADHLDVAELRSGCYLIWIETEQSLIRKSFIRL